MVFGLRERHFMLWRDTQFLMTMIHSLSCFSSGEKEHATRVRHEKPRVLAGLYDVGTIHVWCINIYIYIQHSGLDV